MTLTLAQYVQQYGAQAEQIQNQTGVDAATLLAISYNEGGADPNTIAGGLYPGQYAFFGVKGTGGNAGAITIPSNEVIGGRNVLVTSTFNAYSSFASAAQGFVQFLQNNSRYGTALANLNSPRTFIADLGMAGYATDPTWVSKIQSLQQQISGQLPSNDGSTQPPPTSYDGTQPPLTSSDSNSSSDGSSTADAVASGAQLVSAESAAGTMSAPTVLGSTQLGTIASRLSSKGFWWSVGFFVLAGLLIVVGLIVYFHKQIEQTVISVGKDAAEAAAVAA